MAALSDDLPPGFKPVSGKRAPKDGEWHILLRCGFCDTRIAYAPEQLRWTHEGNSGDIIAVRWAG